MSVAVMLTYDNLPDLEYISFFIQKHGTDSDSNESALKLITNAIDILKGKYDTSELEVSS